MVYDPLFADSMYYERHRQKRKMMKQKPMQPMQDSFFESLKREQMQRQKPMAAKPMQDEFFESLKREQMQRQSRQSDFLQTQATPFNPATAYNQSAYAAPRQRMRYAPTKKLTKKQLIRAYRKEQSKRFALERGIVRGAKTTIETGKTAIGGAKKITAGAAGIIRKAGEFYKAKPNIYERTSRDIILEKKEQLKEKAAQLAQSARETTGAAVRSAIERIKALRKK